MKNINRSKFLSIIALLLLLSFIAACGSKQPEATETGPSTTTAASGSTAAFKGTWIRQATYANNELVGQDPATLELTANSYKSSTNACSTSGDLEVKKDSMVMIVKQTDCPGPIGPGTRVTYTYSLAGDQMTIINTEYGAEVKEEYKKK
ncbi:TPA: hypothetical protein HA265_03215 [Candidatus Woesearchaeota archaeon]|nr:hypothetical protein [Candidatus Woesearchaeota archaeon]